MDALQVLRLSTLLDDPTVLRLSRPPLSLVCHGHLQQAQPLMTSLRRFTSRCSSGSTGVWQTTFQRPGLLQTPHTGHSKDSVLGQTPRHARCPRVPFSSLRRPAASVPDGSARGTPRPPASSAPAAFTRLTTPAFPPPYISHAPKFYNACSSWPAQPQFSRPVSV